MKKITHFLAAMVVAVSIVMIVTFINEICKYTPTWLDYVIYTLSITMFLYATTGDKK